MNRFLQGGKEGRTNRFGNDIHPMLEKDFSWTERRKSPAREREIQMEEEFFPL